MAEFGISCLVRRLRLHCDLSRESAEAIRSLPWRFVKRPKFSYVLREGDISNEVSVLIAGFAQRQKHTSEGRRQIMSFAIPGDPLDFECLFFEEADFGVQMCTDGVIACVRTDAMRQLLKTHAEIGRAVQAALLADAAVAREWIVNVGRRDARHRIAHLLCEILVRAKAQNIPTAAFEMPFTQEQLGDAAGLTPIHVNRILRDLTSEGVIARKGRIVTVPDWELLRQAGDFDERFLHMSHAPEAAA